MDHLDDCQFYIELVFNISVTAISIISLLIMKYRYKVEDRMIFTLGILVFVDQILDTTNMSLDLNCPDYDYQITC